MNHHPDNYLFTHESVGRVAVIIQDVIFSCYTEFSRDVAPNLLSLPGCSCFSCHPGWILWGPDNLRNDPFCTTFQQTAHRVYIRLVTVHTSQIFWFPSSGPVSCAVIQAKCYANVCICRSSWFRLEQLISCKRWGETFTTNTSRWNFGFCCVEKKWTLSAALRSSICHSRLTLGGNLLHSASHPHFLPKSAG